MQLREREREKKNIRDEKKITFLKKETESPLRRREFAKLISNTISNIKKEREIEK